MSACESCWTQASMHAAMFGGVAADHYDRILRENDEIHPGYFEPTIRHAEAMRLGEEAWARYRAARDGGAR